MPVTWGIDMLVKVLNPKLYKLLEERFGSVIIANHGQRASVSRVRKKGKTRVEVGSGGEYYRVCCPMCMPADRGHHLYVSYMFGATTMGGIVTNGVICFRCGGNIFDSHFSGMIRFNFTALRNVVSDEDAGGLVPDMQPVTEIASPEGVAVKLSDLPDTHPAVAYLLRRGFDPVELSERYGWGFYHSSPHFLLTGRIFIPVYHEIGNKVSLVGYQCRAVPGFSTPDMPKYYTMSGFKKSKVLYNLYRARHHPVVVLTEGVTDAARVGDAAVCLLGKSLSEVQASLLLSVCRHATVVVLLDNDAMSAGYKIVDRLNRGGFSDNCLAGGAVLVPLPTDTDPADYSREELWQLINNGLASKRRVQL